MKQAAVADELQQIASAIVDLRWLGFHGCVGESVMLATATFVLPFLLPSSFGFSDMWCECCVRLYERVSPYLSVFVRE